MADFKQLLRERERLRQLNEMKGSAVISQKAAEAARKRARERRAAAKRPDTPAFSAYFKARP